MNANQLYIDPFQLSKEVNFKMSCSSGNGGQNVNRVATKATLFFPIQDSSLFDENQKNIITQQLKNRITKSGELVIINQESRSAQQNKRSALKILLSLLQIALQPKKIRKKIGIPKAFKEKRLANKKKVSEKKEMRKKVTG